MPSTKPSSPDETPSAAPAAAPVAAPAPAPTPATKPDEAIPGGSFTVNGKLVNAEGQRIHEDGKLLTPEELAAEA